MYEKGILIKPRERSNSSVREIIPGSESVFVKFYYTRSNPRTVLTDVSRSTWSVHKAPVTYSHVFFPLGIISFLRSNDVDVIGGELFIPLSLVRFHVPRAVLISCRSRNCKFLPANLTFSRYLIRYLNRRGCKILSALRKEPTPRSFKFPLCLVFPQPLLSGVYFIYPIGE